MDVADVDAGVDRGSRPYGTGLRLLRLLPSRRSNSSISRRSKCVQLLLLTVAQTPRRSAPPGRLLPRSTRAMPSGRPSLSRRERRAGRSGPARRFTSPAFSSRSRRLVIAPLESSEILASSPAERRNGGAARLSEPRTSHSSKVRPCSARVSTRLRLKRRERPFIRSTMPSTERSRFGMSWSQAVSSQRSTWSRSAVFPWPYS